MLLLKFTDLPPQTWRQSDSFTHPDAECGVLHQELPEGLLRKPEPVGLANIPEVDLSSVIQAAGEGVIQDWLNIVTFAHVDHEFSQQESLLVRSVNNEPT